jgi:hypothetical protein
LLDNLQPTSILARLDIRKINSPWVASKTKSSHGIVLRKNELLPDGQAALARGEDTTYSYFLPFSIRERVSGSEAAGWTPDARGGKVDEAMWPPNWSLCAPGIIEPVGPIEKPDIVSDTVMTICDSRSRLEKISVVRIKSRLQVRGGHMNGSCGEGVPTYRIVLGRQELMRRYPRVGRPRRWIFMNDESKCGWKFGGV